MLPAYIIVLAIQLWLKATFKKYSSVHTSRRVTGAVAAKQVLSRGGAYAVKFSKVAGSMTDKFDPTTNTVYLSESVCDVSSVAAVGVAAHEAGHALQHAENYGPMRLRMALIPVCNIGSQLSFPLMMIGFIMHFDIFVLLGIICFTAVVLIQLITLPVEINASRRAIAALREGGILTESELVGAKKVLTAAAMTYVGALAVSLFQLMYYLRRLKR